MSFLYSRQGHLSPDDSIWVWVEFSSVGISRDEPMKIVVSNKLQECEGKELAQSCS